MLEAYEHRRDALERALTACPDVKAAADCLAGALEQVRMETRAALPDAAARREADRLFDAAKRAALLMMSVTEADACIEDGGQTDRREKLAAILSWTAAGAGAVLTAWLMIAGQTAAAVLALISCAAGAARAMLKPAERAQTAVTQATRPNVYELMRLVDRLMSSIGDALEQIDREQTALPTDAPRVTGELLQPIQMLMEAVYTGDGNYALKAAPQIAAALNDEGVRLVEYSPETRDYFDLFPGTEPDLTIRPAVMQGERVLARGQATEEM